MDEEFEFRRGYHFGVAEEQERIVKLFEDQKVECENLLLTSNQEGELSSVYYWESRIKLLDKQIALIKGEK